MKKVFTLLFAALIVAVGMTHALKEQRQTEAEASEQRIAQNKVLQNAQKEFDAEPTDNADAVETANESATQAAGIEIPIYKSSRGGQIIYHTGYTVSYDADFKTPQWVAWQLTANKARGNEPRYNKFQPDPEVRGAKAYPNDYTNTGYDRGHMAPAADMKWSHQAMVESFYMTNVCPQNRNLNRGDWKDLEELERDWAIRYGAVSIAAGPIYTTRSPQRIGANRVAVPNAFFKVLLVGYPRSPKAYGFVFRNEAGSHSLTYYQTTVDEVERQTGMDFFSQLPDKVENRIEAERPAIR